jgi:formylglycine-generating enzyme required for sulfatase activity
VVHRDIKPGNIMLDSAGTAKVMDFGVARIESSDLTQAGTILGTPGYMSPEQLLGETVDSRSDLYSAGVVLYEMLTGERAFTGSSFASVIYKVINIDLSPPSRLKPAVPGSLDGLVARACAKQAGERFQTAAEFASEMNRALTAGGTSEQAVVNASQHTPTVGGDRPPPPKAAKMWIAAAALLTTAAGIAMAVWFLLPAGRETQPMTEHVAGSTFRDCDTCPEMVVIPAGQFVQGSADTDASRQINEEPRRLVSIDYPLAVSRHEITRAQFAQFVADTGHAGAGCNAYDGVWAADSDRSWRSPGFDQDDSHPATCISWDDAQAYIGWLNRRSGQNYRLLSASEWEYAALAGKASGGVAATETARICESANVADRSTDATYPGWDIFDCQDNYVHTSPVGSFQANAFGIHDMLGNVFEWVADCWNESYADAPSDGSAWLDGDCGDRVLRGGSWFTPPGYVHTAFRNRFAPDYRSSSFGLRVARLP